MLWASFLGGGRSQTLQHLFNMYQFILIEKEQVWTKNEFTPLDLSLREKSRFRFRPFRCRLRVRHEQ